MKSENILFWYCTWFIFILSCYTTDCS